jgi:hypothetical protein
MASVYPSTQWATLRRSAIPGFAGSDIVQGAPVRIASSGDNAFIMVTTQQEKPVGIARDSAIAGNAVTVWDDGNIVRTDTFGMGAGGSFNRMQYLGVSGTSTVVHPQSGVTVTAPVLGAVAGASPLGYPAGSQIWAVGVAYESAAIGDFAAFRVEPRLLSGLVNP